MQSQVKEWQQPPEKAGGAKEETHHKNPQIIHKNPQKIVSL